MVSWLEWLIDGLGITSSWLLAHRHRSGWLFSLAVQVIWVPVAIITHQWAFLPMSLLYGVNGVHGWLEWRSEKASGSHVRRRDR